MPRGETNAIGEGKVSRVEKLVKLLFPCRYSRLHFRQVVVTLVDADNAAEGTRRVGKVLLGDLDADTHGLPAGGDGSAKIVQRPRCNRLILIDACDQRVEGRLGFGKAVEGCFRP